MPLYRGVQHQVFTNFNQNIDGNFYVLKLSISELERTGFLVELLLKLIIITIIIITNIEHSGHTEPFILSLYKTKEIEKRVLL